MTHKGWILSDSARFDFVDGGVINKQISVQLRDSHSALRGEIMPMTRREIAQFLAEPKVAVVAVTAPDGSPHAVPTWFEYRRGEAAFVTEASAYKYKCLRHDPRVTLCVDMRKAPDYKAVILKGRATME